MTCIDCGQPFTSSTFFNLTCKPCTRANEERALAARVVSLYSPDELRAMLIEDLVDNYRHNPGAYDDDLSRVESQESST